MKVDHTLAPWKVELKFRLGPSLTETQVKGLVIEALTAYGLIPLSISAKTHPKKDPT